MVSSIYRVTRVFFVCILERIMVFMKKIIYIIGVLVLSLLFLTLYSTYAIFTTSVSSNTALNLDTTLNYDFGVSGVKRFTLDAQTVISFNMIIKNNTSSNLNYGIYYSYVSGSGGIVGEVVSDASSITTSSNASGVINTSSSKSVPIAIYNNTSSTLVIDIGLVTSSGSLVYPNSSYVVNKTIDDDVLGSDACTSKINYKEDDCYSVRENGYVNTYCKILAGTTKVNNLDKSSASMPELIDGMIPVYHDGTSWVKANYLNDTTVNQWYDYDAKKWANAVTIDNNYVYDKSLNNNNALVSNVTRSGDGASFNGSSNYIQIPTDLGVTLPATYTVRFKTASTGDQILYGDYTTKAALGLYNNNNQLIVILGNNATNVFDTGGLTLNTFYTVTVVYNSLTDITVYLNGTALTKSSSSNNWSWSDTNSYIGKRAAGTYFSGTISNFVVHNKAVSSSEIASLAKLEVPSDNLKLNYDFTSSTREQFMKSNAGTVIPGNSINAYYVWIPRYKYKLFNVDSNAMIPIEIQVEFENKYASDYVKSTGSTNDTWLTHPAFTFGTDELSGIWVGKFETSGTAYAPTIKPNLSSLTKQTALTQFNTSKVFGTSAYLTNDGVSEADAHMMKNTEWGAVAYLKQSKYGLGTTDIANNAYYESNYMAGCGPASETDLTSETTTCTSYTSSVGIKASTTGNITGIYDMAGGASENVMGVMKNTDGTGLTYSSSGFTTSTLPFGSKYVDAYTYGTSDRDYTRRILGDATGEVRGLYDDNAHFVNSVESWFVRGGHSSKDSGAGVFHFNVSDASAGRNYTFRSVLIKNN